MNSDRQTELLIRNDGHIATVTINRPEVRNAMTFALRQELRHVIAQLDADPGTRAIILTGVDPAFCAGVDTRELTDGVPAPDLVAPRGPLLNTITPLIGAVNGPAYTGGLELALCCHMLIASDRATFADTHARLGLTPGWGLSVLLPEAVGIRRARQLMFTCMPITAATALTWGLVNEVVAHDDLLSTAHELALGIVGQDPRAIASLNTNFAAQAGVRQSAAWRFEDQGFLGSSLATLGNQPNSEEEE
jgi:enoyl-CoA hydratase